MQFCIVMFRKDVLLTFVVVLLCFSISCMGEEKTVVSSLIKHDRMDNRIAHKRLGESTKTSVSLDTKEEKTAKKKKINVTSKEDRIAAQKRQQLRKKKRVAATQE